MNSAVARVNEGVPYACALLYAFIVTSHGVPALRQDWSWPVDAASTSNLFPGMANGWDVRELGSPNLHLNAYIIGTAAYLVVRTIGTHLGLWVFMFCIGLACSLGATRLSGELGAGAIARAGMALFATFNPFVYTETVAGHIYMVLAYGATMALLAEVLRKRPRPAIAALFVALTSAQLQFLPPALLLATLMGVARKQWLPLTTWIVVSAPFLAGLVAEYDAFRGVPTNLTWERSQSVPLASAAVLNGYFAGYGQSIHELTRWPIWAIAAVASFGCAVGRRRVAASLAAVVVVLSILIAAGLNGPLGAALTLAFASAPAVSAYRELYDVLAYAAVGYVVGVALAAARYPITGAIALAAGMVLAAAWLVHSPWGWWVPAGSIPSVRIDLPNGTRFALMPAFQPLKFHGRGSGVDPDAYVRFGVVPLNTETPGYPIDAALARYELSGDRSSLSALGVGIVVSRPWLTSDAAGLRFQRAIKPRATTTRIRSSRIRGQPLVALMPIPRVGSVDNVLGAGAIHFADAADVRGEHVPKVWSSFRPLLGVSPATRFVRAQDGWVDARLAFASDPELAQAFGGAMTTSPSAFLRVDAHAQALVFVRGSLLGEDGSLVSPTTDSYRWVVIPEGVATVRCVGMCVVAAQGFPPAGVPSTPPAAKLTALGFDILAPWLISTSAPAGQNGALRLNEAYDKNWLALAHHRVLPHLRIDMTVNGWLLPKRTVATKIWLIQWAAAVEAVFEVVGGAWLIGLAFIGARPRKAT